MIGAVVLLIMVWVSDGDKRRRCIKKLFLSFLHQLLDPVTQRCLNLPMAVMAEF